jgi:moderate conductance mechanosensitive channel
MWESILAALEEWLSPEFVVPATAALFRILLLFVAAAIATKFVARVVPALRQRVFESLKEDDAGRALEMEKRAKTVGGIVRRTTVVLIWAVALAISLREIGFDIAPILAGAGVVGLAVGFGAQNLVRDVITGLFMLLENQIRVGDVAQINGTGGLVEEINLRTTVLRGLDGTVHIFPNGTITTLSNMTREFSYYVFDTGVAYKEDTDRVVAVLSEIAEELRTEEGFRAAILEPLEVLGVDQFADSAVVVKTRIKTQPLQQWRVGREMNRRIKKRFDREGIEIPFPHRTLYFGEASPPFQLQLDGKDRDVLRETVRDILREDSAGASRDQKGD